MTIVLSVLERGVTEYREKGKVGRDESNVAYKWDEKGRGVCINASRVRKGATYTYSYTKELHTTKQSIVGTKN